LELTLGIAVVVAGAWTKEAEPIGVDGFRETVRLECVAEVVEVVPGGLGGDKTACNVEAGVIVNGEQKDLFGERGPPLVDGTVVLIKFADSRTAEAAVGPFSRFLFEVVCKSLH